MNDREHESEPMRGLPERLPEGEAILWQGSPSWRGLARRVLHARKVAAYFAVLLLWRVAAGRADGLATAEIVAGSAGLALLATVAIGLLCAIAWLHHRATIYTITDRRIVVRCGIALTLAINLPLRAIRSAELRAFADGTGDIPVVATGTAELGYAMLWPHVRPWRFGKRCQPMLRQVPDVRNVAGILARALAASGAGSVPPEQPASEPAGHPVGEEAVALAVVGAPVAAS